MLRLRARHVVTPDRVLDDGVVVIEGERIVGLEPAEPRIPGITSTEHEVPGTPAGLPEVHLDGWLVPGFVDTHCHGGGGVSLVDDPATAARAHLAHGTTSLVASTVTQDLPTLLAQVSRLADACERGWIAGIHLEGPFLAPSRRGAHPVEHLLAPRRNAVDQLLQASRGHVRMITLAPELPGALAAIRRLVDAGVVVAIGHTDADAARTRAALDAGATVATHLWNAMPTLHHRDPGPVPALLADPRVTVELILDGHHLAPEVAALTLAAAGVDRVALVTDAMAAAGASDGAYRLGQLPVRVTDGVARVVASAPDQTDQPGPLAGSTLTMDRAVAYVVGTLGRTIPEAAAMAATNPARALGLADVGALARGNHADACLLADDGTLLRTWRRGQEQRPAPAARPATVGCAARGKGEA